MTHDFDVLVAGELNADLILRGDVTPAFGQVEKLVDDAALTLGSSSAICACGLARLGLRVAFAGVVGDDLFGHFMRDSLAGRGIDTTGVVVDPRLKTGLTVILSRGEDRAMLTYPGSIAMLRFDHIPLSMLPRARHLHLGSYFLLDRLRPDVPKLFDAAHAHDLTVSIDTNYDPAEKWDGGLAEALARTDLFLPNETELYAIAREKNVEGALKAMPDNLTVAVKLGVSGAIARRDAETAQADILKVDVLDTTGAGDSFDAGFIYGHLAGWALPRALRFASICGSLSTRAAGGTTAQATLEEALAYL
jgi:sugar/nucleoside kinase (ribokinase family)